MKRFVLFVAIPASLAGCVNSCSDERAGRPTCGGSSEFTATECDAGDAAFVRTASLAILGRRTYGQYEVTDILSSAGSSRERVLDRFFDDEEPYVERWSEAIMDHLRIAKIDDQELGECYGVRSRSADGGQLARHVRETPADGNGDGNGDFTMRDLLDSAIRADDLSPVYRAHLFAMLSRPIPAANVPAPEAEAARRQDFGFTFDTVYLNRDLVCLGCHNSQFSVTDGAGEADRHWPVPGLFEQALYGNSAGATPANAHAMFQCEGFSNDPNGLCMGAGDLEPWDWAPQCGRFAGPATPDPYGVPVAFGSLTGTSSTVYELESALQRGVDLLADDCLVLDGNGVPRDPDAAFAYLLGMSIAEMAWKEIVGTPLTTANYFPRNQAQRDELQRITDVFVGNHFSLRALITAILASPYINQQAPAAGCGAGPYVMPAIFDPWVLGEATEELRHNSPADGIAPLPPLVLTRAAHSALGWPLDANRMFDTNNVVFLRGTGVFLKNAEPGFRGLDFQARLFWEDTYAPCSIGGPDFVTDVVSAAGSATLRDVVLALKDRIVNETDIDSVDVASGGSGEAAAIEALFGATLDSPASSVTGLEASARRYCGALLSSPQFLMSGLVDPTDGPPPALNPGP